MTNTGSLQLTDDSAVVVGADVTLNQNGTFHGAARPVGTLGALTVKGTLKRSVQSMEGLQLFILGTLDVQTDADINVSGSGGLGGRQGTNTSGSGERWTAGGATPSGGASGRSGGSYGTSGTSLIGSTNGTYGDAMDPVAFGSGGGSSSNSGPKGGNGGGRLDITATDAILDGQLRANGSGCNYYCGSGSGGAIRVVLTGNLAGTGTLSAVGGGGNSTEGAGGGGRIAVKGNTTGSFTGTVSAGTSYVNGVLQ